VIILIPAFEPDGHLLEVISTVRAAGPRLTLVVVDDGSGSSFKQIFDDARRLGCHIVSHPVNHGKGHALKAGFAFVADHFPGQDVVCADSDGQHSVVDILRVAENAGRDSTAMVPHSLAVNRKAGSSGMAVAPGTSSTQSSVQVTFGSTLAAGTAIQLADAGGKFVATFVTTKSAASLVFSSAAIKAGEVYTVYTGGTAKVGSGLGEGSLDGAKKVSTVTAGEYATGHGPGAR
jgi:glycosyltransferase involved in cell wall biosynthesis